MTGPHSRPQLIPVTQGWPTDTVPAGGDLARAPAIDVLHVAGSKGLGRDLVVLLGGVPNGFDE